MLCDLAMAGVIAGAMSYASTAFAGAILEESYSGMVSLQSTDWVETLSVPQFDDTDGARQLLSIGFRIDGSVTGSAALESMDNALATVIVELSAQISLSLSDMILGVVIPLADDSFNASAYDGAIDFAGTSGMTFGELAAADADDTILIPADDAFSAFLGAGTVDLTGKAEGSSFGSGAGNLVLQFTSQAEMAYRITYRFAEIPAPGSMAVLALPGLLASRRRR